MANQNPRQRSDEHERGPREEFDRSYDAPQRPRQIEPKPGDDERNERWRRSPGVAPIGVPPVVP